MHMMLRNDSTRRKGGGRPACSPLPAARAVRHLAGQLAGAAVLAALLVSAAPAATPVWRGATMHYAVNGAPLPDVLRDVLAVEGLTADIGRDVKGVVNGRFDDTPGNVFAQLVEAYGLVWYFDGRAMHVTSAAGVRSRVIPFAPLTRDAVASLLRNLDLDDARLPVRYSPTTARVAGPAIFVDAVAEAIDKAQRQATVEPSFDQTVIRIFPLRYAQAEDIHYTVRSQDQVVPGVASLLRRLMNDTWQASVPAVTRSRAEVRNARGAPPPLPSLRGLGLAGTPSSSDSNDDSDTHSAPPLPGAQNAQTAPPAATPARRNILADPRTNSVVVNDLASMMPNYERAIAMLDQPQELVEIDAVVIDVSSSAARSLGMQWGGASGRVNGASGTMNAPVSFGNPGLLTPASAASGLNLATLVGNSAQYLFAQLHALEDAGKARVLSRPQVLTLNNTEAVLTSRSSVYVRVAGNQDVDLFNIDVGLTLKVTPSVEATGDARSSIRLNIQIEDGGFNSTMSVDGIPKVDNHSIVTQAVVRDGESLLIGGYQYERSESSTSKVPWLGDVPYVGALFRSTGTTHERLVRLILITPRMKRASGGDVAPDLTSQLARASAVAPATAMAVPSQVGAALLPAGQATQAKPSGQSMQSAPSALEPVNRMPWENRRDR
ncbi:EscC/YscC/HrcC family type III secretion system outer membrane ring protein [Paraburkholderia fungorum]|uniref:type III secretion system outer membrane ring subunit SctC n=1 Tax=Paraburkholderia fungorum TaxID=134537 RepID=UPI000484326B